MKETAKDKQIAKLKKQVEKLKSGNESLKRENRSIKGKLATAQAKADSIMMHSKKKRHRKVGWTGRPTGS